MDKNKKMNIKTEDLAIPELQYDDEEKEIDNISDNHEITIDYDGAVPEIHIGRTKKND